MAWALFEKRAAGSALALAALLVVTVGPKVWLQSRSAGIDIARLDGDVATRLRQLGYVSTIARGAPDPLVVATGGGCHIVARNGDRARELQQVFDLQAPGAGPVLIGYRGQWHARPAGGRSVAERMVQNAAARFGIAIDRPAVLAVNRTGHCPNIPSGLDGIVARAGR